MNHKHVVKLKYDLIGYQLYTNLKLQCNDMNLKYCARVARKIIVYRLVTFSDEKYDLY